MPKVVEASHEIFVNVWCLEKLALLALKPKAALFMVSKPRELKFHSLKREETQ